MSKATVSTAVALLCVAAPAFAATSTITPPATVWYVAQNVKTANCIVTPSKPNGSTYKMIGTATFPTVAAATKDMRSETACKPPAPAPKTST